MWAELWAEWLLLCHVALALLCGWYGLHLTAAQYALIALAFLYVLSPIDLIPDAVPVVGLLDDYFVLLGVLWVCGMSLVFLRAYVRARQRFADRDPLLPAQPAASGGSALRRGGFAVLYDDPPDDDPEGCAVCLERPKNAILVPCGHRMCAACTDAMRRHGMPCPICRRVIAHAVLP
mmetsp:Transcript_24519/g.59666  ORF Transcript_24519/g.59666 Transcript_24519/m.59666 type:complete len:177 (+) Transcript_24519:129-659(+)